MASVLIYNTHINYWDSEGYHTAAKHSVQDLEMLSLQIILRWEKILFFIYLEEYGKYFACKQGIYATPSSSE